MILIQKNSDIPYTDTLPSHILDPLHKKLEHQRSLFPHSPTVPHSIYPPANWRKANSVGYPIVASTIFLVLRFQASLLDSNGTKYAKSSEVPIRFYFGEFSVIRTTSLGKDTRTKLE